MKILNAGPVKAGYENGFLRRITYGQTEVLRMIYFALRDQNWNTLAHHIENENIIIDDNAFRISYDCLNTEGGVTIMTWKAKIEGNVDGSILFEIAGIMNESFRKNRAGFCVLHPLNIAGENCKTSHPDGSTTLETFPTAIAAENPFRNISSMSWIAEGSEFKLSFEGDIFETEDQRNWGDASFKTFCTPLNKPFPVLLNRGDKVFQRITFRPEKSLLLPAPQPSYVTLYNSGDTSILPIFGVAASTEIPNLREEHIVLLRALRLGHYRIDLYPGEDDFALQFSNAYETAYATGLPLEVVLHLTENFPEEMEAFTVLCQQNKVRLKKVLLLSSNGLITSQEIIDQIMPLKNSFPRVLFGAGTNYNFNEINKNHVVATNLDYISFSVDPQEHAFDNITMLENIGTLEHLIKSAKSIYGVQMPVHISPITLRKRFNPYATNPADLFIDERLKADPRQIQNFGAIWTFGSICNLAKGGAAAVTLYQTIGNQGLISGQGDPYPLYEVLKAFGPYQGRPASVLGSSDPLSVGAIILDGNILAMVNLSDEEKNVRWEGAEYRLASEEIRFQKLNRS